MKTRRSTAAAVFAVATVLFLGEISQAQPAPVQAPTLKATALPAASTTTGTPRRIYRKPPNFQLKTSPITNRRLATATLNSLIASNLNVKYGTLGPIVPRSAPDKLALVVILENGGIRNNIQQPLRDALDIDIQSAVCGSLEFELQAGESLASLVGRVAGMLGENFLHCIDPRNWRIKTVNLLDWVHEQSDLMLENVIKGQNSMLNTQNRYDRVLVLEDSNAKPANVIAAMRGIAATHTIDVHVLTHGGIDFFSGYNGAAFNNASFFSILKNDTDARRMFIRTVYQMNCFSSTLKNEWTSLGAIAVNGTQSATLNSMPHQYLHFMGYWLQNSLGMQQSSQKSWEDAAFYTRIVYEMVGMGSTAVNDSRLTSVGSNNNANVATAR